MRICEKQRCKLFALLHRLINTFVFWLYDCLNLCIDVSVLEETVSSDEEIDLNNMYPSIFAKFSDYADKNSKMLLFINLVLIVLP